MRMDDRAGRVPYSQGTKPPSVVLPAKVRGNELAMNKFPVRRRRPTACENPHPNGPAKSEIVHARMALACLFVR
jgi:hypothetical protein